jgi:hypothetical protein
MSSTDHTQGYVPMPVHMRARSRSIAEEVETLLNFHRQTFGGYTMTSPTPEPNPPAPTPEPSNDPPNPTPEPNPPAPTPEPSNDPPNPTPDIPTGTSGQGDDKGFPENTPVVEMTTEQQVAYYKHQNRKAETRAAAYHQAVGGKSPEEVKAEAEKWAEFERQQMSETDRKIEDVKTQTAAETARTVGTSAARTVLDMALADRAKDMTPSDRAELLDTLDLTKVLTDKNELDADKVQRLVERIAPAARAGGNGSRRPDYGSGDRGSSRPQVSGVAAGQALFDERRAKTTPAT